LRKNLQTIVVLGLLLFGGEIPAAFANDCSENPKAIGTGRVIAVDPRKIPIIGTTEQFLEKLPLDDHEVVLTFDDGPESPNTEKVLDALASECVKATYFLVGDNVRKFPELVRRMRAEGHSIGTHTETHPHLPALSFARAKTEIEQGVAAVEGALGNDQAPAPFFRAPYLETTDRIRRYLVTRGMTLWGADADVDDYEHGKGSAEQIAAQAIAAIQGGWLRGKGVLLLHDVEPATAEAVPLILKKLKALNYRIVQVVPVGFEHN
jgi:peptidoglycan-N-acetylglucosamine deacetylase